MVYFKHPKFILLAVLKLAFFSQNAHTMDQQDCPEKIFRESVNRAMYCMAKVEQERLKENRAIPNPDGLKLCKEALENYEQALILGDIKDSLFLSMVHRNTSIACSYIAEWDKCIHHCHLAIQHGEKLNDHKRLAIAYMERVKDREAQASLEFAQEGLREAAFQWEIYLSQTADATVGCYLDAFKAHISIGNQEKANAYLQEGYSMDPDRTTEFITFIDKKIMIK